MPCQLVSVVGWVIQIALGLVAFSTLIFKRYWDLPRRSWKIWFFDASKQGIAATLVHFINILLSRNVSSNDADHDACSWYFMNVLLDCTFGLFLLYWLLRGYAWAVRRYKWRRLESGNYGSPPRYRPWMMQLLAYNAIMLSEKLIVGSICLLPFMRPVGNSLLEPLAKISQTLELVVAMLLMPFVINALWFWVVDNLLMAAETGKKKKPRKRDPDSFDVEMSEFERSTIDDDDDSDDDNNDGDDNDGDNNSGAVGLRKGLDAEMDDLDSETVESMHLLK